ncbi:hypothetical protein FACS1894166_10100 [Bacilli bacterium]|nr:hypothetical protein FACS1894166_10100 [Bacilli bacterium]
MEKKYKPKKPNDTYDFLLGLSNSTDVVIDGKVVLKANTMGKKHNFYTKEIIAQLNDAHKAGKTIEVSYLTFKAKGFFARMDYVKTFRTAQQTGK